MSDAKTRVAASVPIAVLTAVLLHAFGLDVLPCFSSGLRSASSCAAQGHRRSTCPRGYRARGRDVAWANSCFPYSARRGTAAGRDQPVAVVTASAALRIDKLNVPRRVEASDLIVAGSAAMTLWAVLRPLRGLDSIDRLSFEVIILDRMAHFALFDAIGHIHGYAFVHQAAARQFVQPPTEVVYPQGSHTLLALWSSFISNGHSLAGPALLERYFTLVAVVMALTVGAAAWAARWIAGPELHSAGAMHRGGRSCSFHRPRSGAGGPPGRRFSIVRPVRAGSGGRADRVHWSPTANRSSLHLR